MIGTMTTPYRAHSEKHTVDIYLPDIYQIFPTYFPRFLTFLYHLFSGPLQICRGFQPDSQAMTGRRARRAEAMTTRGCSTADFQKIADFLDRCCKIALKAWDPGIILWDMLWEGINRMVKLRKVVKYLKILSKMGCEFLKAPKF